MRVSLSEAPPFLTSIIGRGVKATKGKVAWEDITSGLAGADPKVMADLMTGVVDSFKPLLAARGITSDPTRLTKALGFMRQGLNEWGETVNDPQVQKANARAVSYFLSSQKLPAGELERLAKTAAESGKTVDQRIADLQKQQTGLGTDDFGLKERVRLGKQITGLEVGKATEGLGNVFETMKGLRESRETRGLAPLGQVDLQKQALESYNVANKLAGANAITPKTLAEWSQRSITGLAGRATGAKLDFPALLKEQGLTEQTAMQGMTTGDEAVQSAIQRVENAIATKEKAETDPVSALQRTMQDWRDVFTSKIESWVLKLSENTIVMGLVSSGILKLAAELAGLAVSIGVINRLARGAGLFGGGIGGVGGMPLITVPPGGAPVGPGGVNVPMTPGGGLTPNITTPGITPGVAPSAAAGKPGMWQRTKSGYNNFRMGAGGRWTGRALQWLPTLGGLAYGAYQGSLDEKGEHSDWLGGAESAALYGTGGYLGGKILRHGAGLGKNQIAGLKGAALQSAQTAQMAQQFGLPGFGGQAVPVWIIGSSIGLGGLMPGGGGSGGIVNTALTGLQGYESVEGIKDVVNMAKGGKVATTAEEALAAGKVEAAVATGAKEAGLVAKAEVAAQEIAMGTKEASLVTKTGAAVAGAQEVPLVTKAATAAEEAVVVGKETALASKTGGVLASVMKPLQPVMKVLGPVMKFVGKVALPLGAAIGGGLRLLDKEGLGATYGKSYEELTTRELAASAGANFITGGVSSITTGLVDSVKDVGVYFAELAGLKVPDAIKNFSLTDTLGMGPDGKVTKAVTYVTEQYAVIGEKLGEGVASLYEKFSKEGELSRKLDAKVIKVKESQAEKGLTTPQWDPSNPNYVEYKKRQEAATEIRGGFGELANATSGNFTSAAGDLLKKVASQNETGDWSGDWQKAITDTQKTAANLGVAISPEVQSQIDALNNKLKVWGYDQQIRGGLVAQGFKPGENGVTAEAFESKTQEILGELLQELKLNKDGSPLQEKAAEKSLHPGSIYVHDVELQKTLAQSHDETKATMSAIDIGAFARGEGREAGSLATGGIVGTGTGESVGTKIITSIQKVVELLPGGNIVNSLINTVRGVDTTRGKGQPVETGAFAPGEGREAGSLATSGAVTGGSNLFTSMVTGGSNLSTSLVNAFEKTMLMGAGTAIPVLYRAEDAESFVAAHVESSRPTGAASMAPNMDAIFDYLSRTHDDKLDKIIEHLQAIRDGDGKPTPYLSAPGKMMNANLSGINEYFAKNRITGAWPDAQDPSYQEQSNATGYS